MKLIAFVGYPLSGKSTAAKIARELDIPVVVMGDIVREEVKKRGLELTDENAGKIANELREKEGMDAIANRCIPRIREAAKKSGIVVVDGIRGIAEVDCFKRAFGDDFILIGVESSLEKRFERGKRRGREDDVSSLEELKLRDQREESWGLKEALERSDIVIENETDLETFKEKVEAILKEFSKLVEVEIRTKIYPTEDEEKVMQAVKNFFPDAEFKIVEKNGEKELIAKAKDISYFRDLLRKQRILDTARQEMLKNVFGNEITIFLNKQTATVSRVNFSDGDVVLSPLAVTFRLYGIDAQRFIDYLAPPTKDGKPIKEIELFE
ncbi:MAG: flagellar hook-basal body complex protein FliE [Archaeoglobus sp.]|nr:flagellar hook-basal body complex protein FliE [Archaeoglobus sp.]